MKKMNTRLFTVTRIQRAGEIRPRITFFGDWLREIGFVPGALVQVLPEPEGLAFHLYDNNCNRYSDLFQSTKEKGGNLIRVGFSTTEGKQGATFVTSGQYIHKGGLEVGDSMIATYEHGMIRARKIDPRKLGFEHVRIMDVSHIRRKYTQEPIPKVRICGCWLSEIGFRVGAEATAQSEPGAITLRLQDEHIEYDAMMKYARKHKQKIVQIAKEPHNRGEPRPCIFISGSPVEKAGFQIGETLAVSYEHGVIKLQTLDFGKLGF